jgi:hypothetical protein
VIRDWAYAHMNEIDQARARYDAVSRQSTK